MDKKDTCCFTGHRPNKLPWGEDESDPRCLKLKADITQALENAYDRGYRHFICGMAQGCDLYFCESILRLRAARPEITLEAAIPCPTQAAAWPPVQRQRYARLVAACDFETMVSTQYSPSLLIAAFDGTPGGTRYTVEYAMRRGVSVVDLPIVLE